MHSVFLKVFHFVMGWNEWFTYTKDVGNAENIFEAIGMI